MLKTYDQLVQEKVLACLPEKDAREVARRQIESDVKNGLRSPEELTAIDNAPASLARANDMLKLAMQQLGEKDARILDLEEKLKTEGSKLTAALAQIDEKNARILELEGKLADADAQIAEQSARIPALEQELGATKKSLGEALSAEKSGDKAGKK
jgi:chromosome segregation ATPase